MRTAFQLVALVLATLTLAEEGRAQSFWERFIDPRDGQFDVSGWLATRGAFLPAPIIITEPAVGYGGGIIGAWFHDKPPGGDPWAELPEDLERPAPNISFAGGGGTENGTWFAGLGHVGSWQGDSIRYTGAFLRADANLDFYVGDQAVGYSIGTDFLLQDLRMRVGDSKWFLGARYQLGDMETTLESGQAESPSLPEASLNEQNAGLAAVAYYDSRNNPLGATSGTEFELRAGAFGEFAGGDNSYHHLGARATHLIPFDGDGGPVYGARLEVEATSDGAPFYSRPFVKLRGIPAMRYQGDSVASFENQIMFPIDPRWSLVGFLGVGGTDYRDEPLPDSGLVVSGGGGFRYLMARSLGLMAGIDVAVGPDGPAVYIQFGTGL